MPNYDLERLEQAKVHTLPTLLFPILKTGFFLSEIKYRLYFQFQNQLLLALITEQGKS